MINKRISQYIEDGRLTFFLCLFSAIILPLHVDFLPPFMILWLITWVVENYKKFNKIWNIENPSVLLFAGFALYFLWYFIGLLYTDDISNGIMLTFRRLPFIVFPLVLISPGEYLRKRISLILKAFSFSTLIYILLSFALALFKSTCLEKGLFTFSPHPPDADYENYFFGNLFSFSQHPTYLAMYVLISAFIALDHFFNSSLKTSLRILWMISAVILVISLYFLSSRAGILSALILLPIYLLIQIMKIKNRWISLLVLFVAIPLLIFTFTNNERMMSFFNEKEKSSFIANFMKDNRVPIWKSAFNVIKGNVLLGVGPGDASHDLRKEYLNEGYTEAYYNNLNAHNQYLEVLLGTGLIGFIVLIYILGFMITYSICNRKLIFAFFIAAMLIFFLFESVLNRLAGVTFFSLMAFLFLLSEEDPGKES